MILPFCINQESLLEHLPFIFINFVYLTLNSVLNYLTFRKNISFYLTLIKHVLLGGNRSHLCITSPTLVWLLKYHVIVVNLFWITSPVKFRLCPPTRCEFSFVFALFKQICLVPTSLNTLFCLPPSLIIHISSTPSSIILIMTKINGSNPNDATCQSKRVMGQARFWQLATTPPKWHRLPQGSVWITRSASSLGSHWSSPFGDCRNCRGS